MTRLLGNLRTLGVLPCGECRAYVPRETGCDHYRPGPARIRDIGRKRVESRNRFDNLYGLMRLAESARMRRVLASAVAAGVAGVELREKNDRHAANNLTRAGLLSLSGRGRPYVITDAGREVWRKVLELLNDGR